MALSQYDSLLYSYQHYFILEVSLIRVLKESSIIIKSNSQFAVEAARIALDRNQLIHDFRRLKITTGIHITKITMTSIIWDGNSGSTITVPERL